jgi:hypothetical protein
MRRRADWELAGTGRLSSAGRNGGRKSDEDVDVVPGSQLIVHFHNASIDA